MVSYISECWFQPIQMQGTVLRCESGKRESDHKMVSEIRGTTIFESAGGGE